MHTWAGKHKVMCAVEILSTVGIGTGDGREEGSRGRGRLLPAVKKYFSPKIDRMQHAIELTFKFQFRY